MILASITTLAIASFAVQASAGAAPKANIVLVHGAFANASGWGPVMAILQKDGYNVTAVENPLTSLDDDVTNTKRVVQAQKGPTVLVGHSYGGAVITGAAAGESNVKGLVYVAAFMPDESDSLGSLIEKFPAPPLASALVPDAAGFLYIDRAKFHDVFCGDIPESEARLMAASQKPLNSTCFAAKLSSAPWKTIPSYFVLATDDRAINPELQRFEVKRAGSNVTELKASHVVFMSHPKEVAKVIEQAAGAATK